MIFILIKSKIMLNDNAKKLVKALRSGKYKQGQDWLRIGNTFCCLGVACDLYRKEFGTKWDKRDMFFGEDTVLPIEVQEWFGFSDEEGSWSKEDHCSLISMNDMGKSFKEIADKIESEPEGLFVKSKIKGNKNAR